VIGHGFTVVEAARPGEVPPTLFTKRSSGQPREHVGRERGPRRGLTYANLAATLALILWMSGGAVAVCFG
jgi:hypothetical protein